MPLGTKNRQLRTAELCKAHLRSRPGEEHALVEEFIRELEGDRLDEQSADPTCWARLFSDEKQDAAEMLARVNAAFAEWLKPPAA